MSESKEFDLSEQLSLLNNCIAQRLNIKTELKNRGLNYDSLRYRFSSPINLSFSTYTTPEDYEFSYHGVPVVSFFSGAGGLDIGFVYAGFEHIASIEINQTFCDTLRKNYPSWVVLGPPDYSGDVRNIEEIATSLRQKIGIESPFEGIFIGGPPCQSFSVAANQRFSKTGDDFKRIGFSHTEYGNLLFDFIWYVQEFKPQVFLIENVAGLLSADEGKQLSVAVKLLHSSGYYVTKPTILNAADYGVPQSRLRVFICGWRSSKNFTFPAKESIVVPCYKAFEKPVHQVENHITRQHKAESIIRYMQLKYGERDRLGRVDRLDPNLPSKTVIAGGTSGGGRSHLHPDIPRTLSVRESARLQTFPDNFVFCGSPARQFTQVGNAVPPLLALKIARAIYTRIYS